MICAALRLLLLITLMALAIGPCLAANPPLCPHVIGWNSDINTWAQGAPWIKVIYANDIAPAKATGAKVFFRPFATDPPYYDNGCLPSARTGSQFADTVWAQISGLSAKPDAVGYRNEFDWSNASNSKRTCQEFVNYKNRLRQLGYTGKVIFGSFSPDWVSATTWQDPDLMAAVNASDGVETHEYFDFLVNCCLPNRCFRHRDIALANNPYLQSKDWYIGEFGSDSDYGACSYCGDGLYRTGWRDRNKLTEQQYIDQMKIYRAGCANQVVAVFVFQQGDQTSWSAFEVVGTSVATYMQTTWTTPPPPPPVPGQISGTVRDTSANLLTGATITVTPGNYAAQTVNGAYSIGSLAPGTYSVGVTMPGYARQTVTGKTVSSNTTTSVSFALTPMISFSAVKALPGSSPVAVAGVVTAVFSVNGTQNTVYVESEDRSAGCRVGWTGALTVGTKVEVTGTASTNSDYERYINAKAVTPIGTATIRPLVMIGSSVGGSAIAYNPDIGGGQHAVEGWHWVLQPDNTWLRQLTAMPTLNTLGLLVKTAGTVTATAAGYFYLDDGCAWDDFQTPDISLGMPSGLKVSVPSGVLLPQVGSYATVTGISACYRVDTDVYRLLKVYRADDISVAAQ